MLSNNGFCCWQGRFVELWPPTASYIVRTSSSGLTHCVNRPRLTPELFSFSDAVSRPTRIYRCIATIRLCQRYRVAVIKYLAYTSATTAVDYDVCETWQNSTATLIIYTSAYRRTTPAISCRHATAAAAAAQKKVSAARYKSALFCGNKFHAGCVNLNKLFRYSSSVGGHYQNVKNDRPAVDRPRDRIT
jgi:hypothetical protein